MDVMLSSELQPGDYAVIRSRSLFGFFIRAVTGARYSHAFIFLGGGLIAEATLRGVRVDSIGRYTGLPARASTDAQTPLQRQQVCAAARSWDGREYGRRDIFVLLLRHFGARWKWLLRVANDRDAVICSELVALSGFAALPPLDWDCSEPARCYVTPQDLASRVQTAPLVW